MSELDHNTGCEMFIFGCSARVQQHLLCLVLLLVVDEVLDLLGKPPLLGLLLLQGLLCLLALVDLHPGERQTEQQRLQGQDVQEDGDVIQSLRREREREEEE